MDVNDYQTSCIIGEAAKYGRVNMIKVLLNKGATNYRHMMWNASLNGRIEIIQMVINMYNHSDNNIPKSAIYCNNVIMIASRKGHIDIVKLLAEGFGIDGFNIGMIAAANGDHDENRPQRIDIVRLMLEKGANSYNKTAKCAAENAHDDIVEIMMNISPINYNKVLIRAAKGGYGNDNPEINRCRMRIINMMLEKGANNYNKAMIYASKKGHIDIVRIMLNMGATTYDESMFQASKHGYITLLS